MPKLPKFPLSQAFGVPVPRIDAVPNHVFTHNYTQIDDYRFCQDSVILPWFVAQQILASTIADISADFRVLDLCAGCGVIGFELAHYLPELKSIDFVEVQSAFRHAFADNLKKHRADKGIIPLPETGERVDERLGFTWHEVNYDDIQNADPKNQYDLIISNPPYFFVGDGKPATNQIKNRCRFFVDSDLQSYVRVICASLKPTGEAYFLCKLGGTHGRRSWDEIRLITSNFDRRAEVVADIRGTAVVKITALRS